MILKHAWVKKRQIISYEQPRSFEVRICKTGEKKNAQNTQTSSVHKITQKLFSMLEIILFIFYFFLTTMNQIGFPPAMAF